MKELVEKSGQMEDEQFITGISEEKELIFMEKPSSILKQRYRWLISGITLMKTACLYSKEL